MSLKIGVGVLVHWQGHILLGVRKGSHGAGQWAAPGGKPEPQDEGPLETGYREVMQETNLHIVRLKPINFWSYDTFTEDGMDVPEEYITIWLHGEPENPTELRTLEPDKCEGWCWWPGDHLPGPQWASLQGALAAFYGR